MRQASLQIIINNKRQVLMLQRTPEHPLFPNEWCLPGGKRDIDEFLYENDGKIIYIEDIEETNYRETKEELGLKVYVAERLQAACCDDHFLCIPFMAVGIYSDDDITKQFPNREHVQYGWFYYHSLPEGVGQMTRTLIEYALCEV